jgi:hypothetical protein
MRLPWVSSYPGDLSGKGPSRRLCDLVRNNIMVQVDGYTPPAFLQIVDPYDSALFFPIRRITRSKVSRNVNIHAGEIMSNRSREIQPVPSHIQSLANLFGELGFDWANADGLRLVYQG